MLKRPATGITFGSIARSFISCSLSLHFNPPSNISLASSGVCNRHTADFHGAPPSVCVSFQGYSNKAPRRHTDASRSPFGDQPV
jgi:hypothetical protein